MAIVLTNGIYYIYLNNKGKHRKTTDIKQALQYNTVREAIKYMNIAPIKTEGVMYMIHFQIAHYGKD